MTLPLIPRSAPARVLLSPPRPRLRSLPPVQQDRVPVHALERSLLERTPSPLSPEARAAIDDLLREAPFSGRASVNSIETHRWGERPRVVACVPARDETQRLGASLDSLVQALERVDEPTAIVVLINNSADGSLDEARLWAARGGMPVLVADASLDPVIANAGHARRLALDLGGLVASRDAVLLTTDADTRVTREWARRLVGHVRAGAGAAAGMIDVERDEFAALPPRVREIEATERGLFREYERTWRLLVPDSSQALALRVGGASLAVAAEAYRRVGGLPALEASEDRAMVATMLRHDERVAFDARLRVRTSCRLDARVADGMAGMLRGRMACSDPFCDQDLYTAERFAWSSLAWRHLRDRHAGGGDPDDALALARGLGIETRLLEPCRAQTLGTAWSRVEAALEPRHRLRASEVASELPRARSLRRLLSADGPDAPLRVRIASLSHGTVTTSLPPSMDAAGSAPCLT